MNKYLYIAHRGVTQKYPENTLEALKEIINIDLHNNYKLGIEFDIMITKDFKLICHHDNDTLRITGKKYNIIDTNYNILKNLKIRNKFKIPLLEDILLFFKKYDNITLNIEIKDNTNDDIYRKKLYNGIFSMLKKYQINNYILSSFNHEIITLVEEVEEKALNNIA